MRKASGSSERFPKNFKFHFLITSKAEAELGGKLLHVLELTNPH